MEDLNRVFFFTFIPIVIVVSLFSIGQCFEREVYILVYALLAFIGIIGVVLLPAILDGDEF